MAFLLTKCNLKIQIDEDDFTYLSQFKWYKLKARNTIYARTSINNKTMTLTHVLAKKYNWNLKNKVIDHINKNGLDNRKCNLNIITQQENVAKDAGWKISSSKFRGVSKLRNKWTARICKNGKHYYLGVYDTQEEAYQAVLNKRSEVGY